MAKSFTQLQSMYQAQDRILSLLKNRMDYSPCIDAALNIGLVVVVRNGEQIGLFPDDVDMNYVMGFFEGVA